MFNGHPVEVIAYPWEGEVFTRLVPGDPTTAVYLRVDQLTIIPKKRYCHVGHGSTEVGYPYPGIRDDVRYVLTDDITPIFLEKDRIWTVDLITERMIK